MDGRTDELNAFFHPRFTFYTLDHSTSISSFFIPHLHLLDHAFAENRHWSTDTDGSSVLIESHGTVRYLVTVPTHHITRTIHTPNIVIITEIDRYLSSRGNRHSVIIQSSSLSTNHHIASRSHPRQSVIQYEGEEEAAEKGES